MTATNGWPGEPGVPMHPERDGWHWLEDSVDGVGTGHIEAVYYTAWSGPIWYRAGNRSPITKPQQWRYLGPVLTPDEAAVMQARADRNAAGFARVDAEAERDKFLHKQEIAALQKRVAELEDFCEDYLVRFELFHITNTQDAPEDATGFLAEKARAILGVALEGKKDE